MIYEGVVGGVTSVIGGVGGAAKKAEKTVKAVKSAETVVKSAIKTGAKEAASEFLHDVGYQVFAEDKSLADVDYGQAIKAGADSGISAMVGELDDAFGSKKQLSATNRKKASQATGLIDDAADATPRPRTNALPDVEVTPSRGAVKNAAGGLADARVGTRNVGRKTGTALSKDKLKNAKKSSPSLSKNQQKMQNQTVGNTLSGSTDLIQKNNRNGNNSVQTISNKFPNDNQAGKRFNYTTENGRIHIENGVRNVNFVIDMDNNLHIGRGHSYLAGGNSVQAAGSMKVNSQGYIRLITNDSGHFQPTTAQARNYPTIFRNTELNINNTWIRIEKFKTSMSNYVINSEVFYDGPIKNMP